MPTNTPTIAHIPLDAVRPYEGNPRKNDAAVDAVAASIRQFGFQQPILVDADNVIICGHTRFFAAMKIGMAEVPCIVADDLTAEQVAAFRIVDNRTAELAGWDERLLRRELEKIGDLECFNALGLTADWSEAIISNIEEDPLGFFADGEKKEKTITCPQCGHAVGTPAA